MLRSATLWLLALISGSGCLGLIRCEATDPHRARAPARTTPTKEVQVPATIDTRLVSACNQFGFTLFAQLIRQDEDQNIFISPLSIATALTMTYNGAAGETQREMAQTLKLSGLSLPEVNRASAQWRQHVASSDPKVTLTMANSLWARQGVRFQPAFLDINRQFFQAEIATLNFGDPQATDIINRWVDTHTQGKIRQIVAQIDPQTVMFLINAVYFKGKWQTEFDRAQTKEEAFRLFGGKQKRVPMMSQSGRYAYLRGEGFQAISLPYGEGKISLYVFLPDSDQGLGDFLKSLSHQKWEQWVTQFRQMPGDIKLPRFKMEYDKQLNDALKALGMEKAFAPQANFEYLRPERDLFIQEVKHKAFVEVNEEGTEAAAATSVAIGITSAARPQRFTFVADHPFFVAIRENLTGTMLFMGAVIEPQ